MKCCCSVWLPSICIISRCFNTIAKKCRWEWPTRETWQRFSINRVGHAHFNLWQCIQNVQLSQSNPAKKVQRVWCCLSLNCSNNIRKWGWWWWWWEYSVWWFLTLRSRWPCGRIWPRSGPANHSASSCPSSLQTPSLWTVGGRRCPRIQQKVTSAHSQREKWFRAGVPVNQNAWVDIFLISFISN